MDQGLFGELSVQPVTLLSPCLLQYPNLATQLTHIQISFANLINTLFVIFMDTVSRGCLKLLCSKSEVLVLSLDWDLVSAPSSSILGSCIRDVVQPRQKFNVLLVILNCHAKRCSGKTGCYRDVILFKYGDNAANFLTVSSEISDLQPTFQWSPRCISFRKRTGE